MFEVLQQSPREPVRSWVPAVVYGFWCVIGGAGMGVAFWKQGAISRVGLVCYVAVFLIALYSLLAARTRPPSLREVSGRALILLMLSNLPGTIRMLSI